MNPFAAHGLRLPRRRAELLPQFQKSVGDEFVWHGARVIERQRRKNLEPPVSAPHTSPAPPR
jgi:hypothetical protein